MQILQGCKPRIIVVISGLCKQGTTLQHCSFSTSRKHLPIRFSQLQRLTGRCNFKIHLFNSNLPFLLSKLLLCLLILAGKHNNNYYIRSVLLSNNRENKFINHKAHQRKFRTHNYQTKEHILFLIK